MDGSFTNDFKRFFGRGLAILLPTIVTLWLLWQAFAFVYANVAQPINGLTRRAVVWVVPLALEEKHRPGWFVVTDEELATERIDREVRDTVSDTALRATVRSEFLAQYWKDHWYLNLAGLFIAILLIYLAGVLLGNIVGRTIYHWIERLITQIPGFKQVYPHVKQVVDMVMGEKKMAFRQVVIVEYPSPGIWTVGFRTGESLRVIDASAGERVASVFIPTSPTPFTGFTINVPEGKIRRIEMSVEEALRFVITAGVLTPGKNGAVLGAGDEGSKGNEAESGASARESA